MAIQTKVCKLCKEEKAVGLAFSKNENSDDGWFPFCSCCVQTLKFGQVVRWNHYFNPNFKPTRGWNPFYGT